MILQSLYSLKEECRGSADASLMANKSKRSQKWMRSVIGLIINMKWAEPVCGCPCFRGREFVKHEPWEAALINNNNFGNIFFQTTFFTMYLFRI